MKSSDERVKTVAAKANIATYDSIAAREYINGAPHIKHLELRELFSQSLIQLFDAIESRKDGEKVKVLDLGAGEGSATLPFLELGAIVTAVDISGDQLQVLSERCADHKDRLVVRHQDIYDALKSKDGVSYDIVVANSFLHHIPDYIGLLDMASSVIGRPGGIFCFQDPMRYDRTPIATRVFSKFAYAIWRISQPDAMRGIFRRMRRMRGIYIDDCPEDNAEYHVVRNGVDEASIQDWCRRNNFECEVVKYFSTQSSVLQPIGRSLSMQNTFGIIAKRV